MTENVQWFAGIDWASQTHQVCLIDGGGKIVGERGFAHGGAGLCELCSWLLTMTRGLAPAIAVAIEVPHGPIVEALLERGFQVHAITRSSSTGFAIGSPWLEPRTIAAMLMCSPTACEPTGTASGSCRPRMQPSSSCASGRA